MKKFKGADFLRLDTLLSEEELMVRDAIREWVDDQVIPAGSEVEVVEAGKMRLRVRPAQPHQPDE